MRFFVIFSLVSSLSMSLIAEQTHFKLETYDEGARYQIVLSIEDDFIEDGQSHPVRGFSMTHGRCMGEYVMDPVSKKLTVQFKKRRKARGCKNESFSIDMKDINIWDIFYGTWSNANLKSRMFPEERAIRIFEVFGPDDQSTVVSKRFARGFAMESMRRDGRK